MARAPQKRTLETRARLLAAAEEIIGEGGFQALRVEEVARRAGVAKGTVFAHFKDKDALMDRIIGARIDAHLDRLEAMRPKTAEEMAEALTPLSAFMTSERYVFDVILRYSGAAGVTEIGPIAETFGRAAAIFETWLEGAPLRTDISPALQAEGIQAFMIQAISLQFCALHNSVSFEERLAPYLSAWLTPRTG